MADVEHVHRKVIDGKLLAALDDKEKVAMILREEDLLLLAEALDFHFEHFERYQVQCERNNVQLKQGTKETIKKMIVDICQLREEAFVIPRLLELCLTTPPL